MIPSLKPNRLPAIACAGSVVVCLALGNARAEDHSAMETVTSTLSLTLRCTNATVKAGDEIPIEFQITNRGTNDYRYADRTYDRSGRMDEYSLIAKNAAGETVPDPRASNKLGWFGGGLFQYAVLKPGQSFTKIIPLNRWALIKEPGRYEVVGTYRMETSSTNAAAISSNPVTVTVLPRTEQEMNAYIKDLTNQLEAKLTAKASGKDPERFDQSLNDLLLKLMFTCSPKTVPALLDAMYQPGQGFWESEALMFYVPHSDEVKQTVINTATKRGLANGMQMVLSQFGCTATDFAPFIQRSLAPDNPQSWTAGALAAQQYASDAFTPRLIALATEPQNPARPQAIYALAANRTGDGIKTLRRLLNDPDQKIRETTEQAIRTAYNWRGIWQGRRLKPEDFDEKYQRTGP